MEKEKLNLLKQQWQSLSQQCQQFQLQCKELSKEEMKEITGGFYFPESPAVPPPFKPKSSWVD